MIVVGLGAMGSSAAMHLATRGVRVLGLEQFTPGHDKGSSHGDSRIIRQAYFEHPAYVPLIQQAYRLWAELEDRAGTHLLTLTGGLLIGPADSATITGGLRSAQRWGLPHEMLDAATIRSRHPTFTPGDELVGLYEQRAGFVVPEEAVRAQIRVAARDGATLRFGERVVSWEPTGTGVRVSTETETFTAGHLVLAAGAWAPRLLGRPTPLAVERQVMHWYEPAGGTKPFAVGHHPVFVWEDSDGDQIYGFPALRGETDVKVTFFRRIVPTDPDHVDRTVHAAEIDELTHALEHKIPSLTRHSRAATCLYTLTPDHHFVVGPHPHRPHVTVAAGFSGHGFKFAPVIGHALADLATRGETDHDISLFDPSRSALSPHHD